MSNNVTVYLTLALIRLPDSSSMPVKARFLVNWVASFDSDQGIPAKDSRWNLLRPWTWKVDQAGYLDVKVRLWRQGATGPVEVPATVLQNPGGKVDDQVLGTLKQRLEKLEATVDKDGFVLDPFGPTSDLPDTDETGTTPSRAQSSVVPGRTWFEVQAQVARLPSPLGHALHTLAVIETDQVPQAGEEWIASPEFQSDEVRWTVRSVTPPGQPGDSAYWKVDYEASRTSELPTSTITVVGAASPWAFASAPELWFRKSEIMLGGREWFGRLHRDLAATLDLAMHLVRAARAIGTKTGSVVMSKATVAWLRAAVLTALRWQLHPGAFHASSAQRRAFNWSADHLYEQTGSAALNPEAWVKSKSDSLAKLIEHDLKTRLEEVPPNPSDPTLDAWRALLGGALGEGAPAWMRGPLVDAHSPIEPDSDVLQTSLVLDELESLVKALRDPAALAEVIVAHWQAVKLPEPLTPRLSAKLAEAAAENGMAERLLVDRIAGEWTGFLEATGEPEADIKRFRARASGRLREIIEAFLGAGSQPPKPPDFTGQVVDSVVEAVAKSVDRLGPEMAPALDELESVQPLVVTAGALIDPVTPSMRGQLVGGSALLAGVAFLMRRTNPAPSKVGWHVLNIGGLAVPGSTGTKGVALVPRPIATIDGFESTTVSYDGHPLACETLFSKLVDVEDGQGDPSQVHLGLQIRQLEPSPDLATDADWYSSRVPGLYFGAKYQLAGFRTMVGGAIPRELIDDNTPLLLKLPIAVVPDSGIVDYTHLRRTRIGSLRLVGAKPKEAFSIPRIPREEGIWPIADDVVQAGSTSPAEEPGNNSALADLRQDHLCLLIPPAGDPKSDPWRRDLPGMQSFFEFRVRPPAVDEKTWRQWVGLGRDGNPLVDLAEQAGVLDTTYKTLEDRSRDPLATPTHDDLALDDPVFNHGIAGASGGRCGFRLARVAFDSNGLLELDKSSARSLVVEFPIDSGPNRIKDGFLFPTFQSPGLVVRAEVSDREDLAADAGSRVSVKVVTGQCYLLEVVTLVKPDLLSGAVALSRFAFSASSLSGTGASEIWKDSAGTEWISASRVRLILEVAKAAMVGAGALWRQARVLGVQGPDLVLGIDPAGPGLTDADQPLGATHFDYLKRAKLEIQRWRWTGRSVPAIPKNFADQVKGADLYVEQPADYVDFLSQGGVSPAVSAWQELVIWDGSAFGDRPDDDSLTQHGLLPGPGRRGANAGISIEKAARVYGIDLAQDPRAQYFRFRATVFSRYLGLLRPEVRGDGVGSRRSSWRRVFIKNRRTEVLSKPKLRFVLPLTQESSSQTHSAEPREVPPSPLLALFEETVGAECGLAETMDVQVMKVKFPARETGQDYPELGPDPRESGDGSSGDVALDESPYALTFDFGVPTPWPATSVWVLRLVGGGGPGVFAKVRFRRKARADLSVAGASGTGEPLPSEWTDPIWVPFLSDFRYWQVARGDEVHGASPRASPMPVSNMVLRRSGVGLEIWSSGSGGGSVLRVLPSIPAETDRPLQRRVFVVLTREVFEVVGNRKGEAPIALASYPQAGAQLVLSKVNLGPQVLKARLIEVEFRGSVITGVDAAQPLEDQALWRQLFEIESVPDDQRAMIVRVSPPIGESGAP